MPEMKSNGTEGKNGSCRKEREEKEKYATDQADLKVGLYIFCSYGRSIPVSLILLSRVL